ncbi:DUF6916 family protein [Chloroflexota bacterium]
MDGYNSEKNEANKLDGVSRRKFLTYALGGATGAAALALHGNTILTKITGDTTPMDRLKQMDKKSFVERLGDTFEISKGALDTVSLQLTEIKDLAFYNAGRAGEVFSLLFKGPHTYPLEQGTYVVENKAVGSFQLFLVPTYPEINNMYYEAIFNRLEA